MKYLFIVVTGLSLACRVTAQVQYPVSGVSVIVNNDVITYGEIAEKIRPRIQTAAQLYASDRSHFEQEAHRIRAQQIEDMVERKLILHEFTASAYATNVLEAMIDERITKRIQDLYYGDRSRLIKTLQAQGKTYEEFRSEEREDFIVGWMAYHNVDEPKKILISPLKMDQYYKEHQDSFQMADQIKLRMIFIPQLADDPPGEAKRTAQEIVTKIDSGVPFEEMASVYTAGSTRAEGGERGWVERSFFKPQLADVAFSLLPGQHSKVIDLPEGCYLMMAEDRRPAHIRPITEVRADIEQTLKSQEHARLHREWIERLKMKSFIRYY